MKKLITMISTEGKSEEQIVQEVFKQLKEKGLFTTAEEVTKEVESTEVPITEQSDKQ